MWHFRVCINSHDISAILKIKKFSEDLIKNLQRCFLDKMQVFNLTLHGSELKLNIEIHGWNNLY